MKKERFCDRELCSICGLYIHVNDKKNHATLGGCAMEIIADSLFRIAQRIE